MPALKSSVLSRINEMMSATPDSRVIIIGEGDYRRMLEEIAAVASRDFLDAIDEYRGCVIAVCEEGADLLVRPRAQAYWENAEAYSAGAKQPEWPIDREAPDGII